MVLWYRFHHIWTDLCDIFHYHVDFGNKLIMFFSQNNFFNFLKKYIEILPKIQSYQLKAKRLLFYSKRLLWIGYRQYKDSFHFCMMVRFYKQYILLYVPYICAKCDASRYIVARLWSYRIIWPINGPIFSSKSLTFHSILIVLGNLFFLFGHS